MDVKTLKNIFSNFDHSCEFLEFSALTSGHINDTFLIETTSKKKFVLQKINPFVFKNVPALMKNKVQISEFLKSKLPETSKKSANQKVLTFVKAKNTKNYFYQQEKEYWNLMVFIEGSYTHEVVKSQKIAFETGKLLGNFIKNTHDFNSDLLTEVIPNFHKMSFRFQQFEEALLNAKTARLAKAKEMISFVQSHKKEMHFLEKLQSEGKIPMRITHNDTKVSNALFDEHNHGICMIDTDTVMLGIIHFDFGDAIRTICNSATEDEKNLSKIRFNFDFYEAYKKGFLKITKNVLTDIEIAHLPLAVKTMIFIMGLRFLTDFLNNDIYYKTKHELHNFDRTANQFHLFRCFSESKMS